MKVTDANERASKGYDDKKLFKCVCCGKEVLLTKFASAKTAKCPECKSAGKQANPNLVPTPTPKKQQAEMSNNGNTKILPCTRCGTMTEVSKFMSAAKVLCDNCKGSNSASTAPVKLKVDISKIDRDTMPTVEDYNILPSNIANKNLREVKCPACGSDHMRILNIIDYSTFGLIIHYQCNRCKLLVSVSEQCKTRCKTQKLGNLYDYSGRSIEDLMTAVESTRLHGTLEKLYNTIKEHNIPLEGIELPPYKYQEDKPVPVGFVIPPEDKWVKTIEDTINFLKDKDDTAELVEKLQGLFKVGE